MGEIKKYALFVQGKEVKSARGDTIMTREGEWFLVCNEPEGWVPATSMHAVNFSEICLSSKIFESEKKAKSFATSWKGHPWWVVPNGTFKIVKVEPVYEQVLKGYKARG